jgi:methylphosphotriester-DNA--protein-cysteine methyltransferase
MRGQMMETAMLSPDRVPDTTPLACAAADYDVVRRAIAFLSEHWRAQPEIEAIAAAAGVSASDLHHLFRRWDGCTISLSPTRRCRRANGSRAAKGSPSPMASIPVRSALLS